MSEPLSSRNPSLRKQLRQALAAFSGMPRALRMVWDVQPLFTVILAGSALAQALLPASTAWAGKLVVDSIVTELAQTTPKLGPVLPAVAFTAGLAFLGLALGLVRSIIEELMRDRLSSRINLQILEKALVLDLEFYESPMEQDKLQRAWQEASFRPLMILQETFAVIQNTITLLSLTGLMIRFSPWVLLLLVITGIPALIVQVKYGQATFNTFSNRAPAWRKLMYYSMLLTNNAFFKEVKLFGLGRHLLGRYRALYTQFLAENRRLAVDHSVASMGLQVLSGISYYAAYIVIIAEAVGGRLTIGDLTLYSAVLMQGPMLAQGLMHSIANLYEQNLFINNLFGFLATQPKLKSGDQPASETLQQGIVFEHVSFHYPGAARPVLQDINLEIRPGEKIALVGENGAGKTTLVKLLVRLYDPTIGRITYDGRNLREIEISSLHRQIAIIFQDFARYNLTARENIGFGQVEALDDLHRVQAAARRSGVDADIVELSAGYETTLGRWFMGPGERDESQDLSLGQWQKVALARAFMRDAPVLVLDEPTASLDARAEYEIFRRFQTLTANCTTILISHRFSTVRMADRIIVLEDGQIVEEGNHAELLALGGKYAQLFNMQADGYR